MIFMCFGWVFINTEMKLKVGGKVTMVFWLHATYTPQSQIVIRIPFAESYNSFYSLQNPTTVFILDSLSFKVMCTVKQKQKQTNVLECKQMHRSD